jgi:hypothetical protein
MMERVIWEPQRETPVLAETDVLVVGGGPAGIGAALAAARHGAKVILLERYGFLGGMATGGYVIVFVGMGNYRGEQIIKGIPQEMVDKLEQMKDGIVYPPRELWGSNDREQIKKWQFFNTLGQKGERIRYSPSVHPEHLKILSTRLLEEAGAELIHHAFACAAIVENQRVKGVVFESKMGRRAILARVTIDCTGDGDIFALAGADFEKKDVPVGLVFRFGGVDTTKADQYVIDHPEEYHQLLASFNKEKINLEGAVAGLAAQNEEIIRIFGVYHRTSVDSVVWFNTSYHTGDTLDIKFLTAAENVIREKAWLTFEFYRRNIPGFENAFLLDTAPQVGTRASRRLAGEYLLTMDEVKNGARFDDTIATCSIELKDNSLINIPYGCLLPKTIDGLLVAGRSISNDFATMLTTRLIPTCILTGQAAGAAAALAVEGDVAPRAINRQALRSLLREDQVYLAQ